MLEAVRSETFGRIGDIRGRGLMWGVECVDAGGHPDGGLASECLTRALRRGVVMLAAGPAGNVLQLAPPLVIAESQLAFGVRAIADSLIETIS
jgi:4-aminobutyrate aminotransferase